MESLAISLCCAIGTSLFYINEPMIEMRELPTKESKVVSQSFFSEKISLEKEQDGWFYITTPDGYTGWIEANGISQRNKPYAETRKVTRLKAHIYKEKDTEYGPLKTVPYGSKLEVLDDSDSRWLRIALPSGEECYIQKGDVAPEQKLKDKADLIDFSKKFLDLPYTWGGRTSFGYDCSGFVQMLYSQIGIHLQRDSKQQILDFRLCEVSFHELAPGDLVFFGKSIKDIRHVGMFIGEGYFIHATARENKPWIRISHVSDLEWSGNSDVYYPYRTGRQLMMDKS